MYNRQLLFNNEIILTNVCYYLTLNGLIQFSSINKTVYEEKLNPMLNPNVNTYYRKLALEQFYFSELLDEIKPLKKESLLDDYKVTGNNWKLIYLKLVHNYHSISYINGLEYANRVYERFQNHLYLPFIRKDNKLLEFKESTLHMNFCYDFETRKNICNHYDKFLDIKNNGFFDTNSDKFILQKKLFFENELNEFNELLRNVNKNGIYILLMEKIVSYDYKGIEEYYNMIQAFSDNKVIYFIIWLNHSCVLFSNLLFSHLILYCKEKNDNNDLIIKYVKDQESFVNFALSVNEHFNNINIIINYLYRFIKDKTNRYYEFSLYKLLFNIFKKEIFDKVKYDLNPKFASLIEEYCKELLDNVNNGRRPSCESKTKQDSFDEDCDLEMDFDDEISIEEENTEISKKYIIEHFMNCITDLSIDEKNALCINHTNIKLDENYQMFENTLINSFVKEIDNSITKDKKPIENVFMTVKNLLCSNDYRYNSEKDGGFKFIRRTKKLFFSKIKYCLGKNILQNMQKELCDNIENMNNNKNKKIENKKIIFNEKELIDELKDEEKIELDNIYKDEINKIKNELEKSLNDNIKYCFIVNQRELINAYFAKEAHDNINIVKELLYTSYLENKFYKDYDNRILHVLKNCYNSNTRL